MTVLLITILTLYVALIGGFAIGFGMVPVFTKKEMPPETKFSVIVAFRNEEENLRSLLESIAKLDYPSEFFEVLFVDDASEDGSVAIINNFIKNHLDHARGAIRILTSERKSESPKKDAIETAVKQAKYDWIVTTDADCILPEGWLSTFNAYIVEKQPDFIAAPVTYIYGSSFLEQFQLLDLLSLQGATIGAFGMNRPFLCNGANLCFRKGVFREVKGYEGNTDIASGDDIFLMEKILKKNPDSVHYLKSAAAIVTTRPQASTRALIAQRIRWAAKATRYTNSFSKVTGILVFAMNSMLILSLALCFTGSLAWTFLLSAYAVKLLIDTWLLSMTAVFFRQRKVLPAVLLSSLVYPFFTMFVAISSFQSGFEWKGRTFKK